MFLHPILLMLTYSIKQDLLFIFHSLPDTFWEKGSNVIPAKAGTQLFQELMDLRFRGVTR